MEKKDDRILECDDRGRIVLPREMRKALGTKYIAVQAPGKILLYPVPKDPVKDLQEMGRAAGLHKFTLAQLKKGILEEAERSLSGK
jgi:bifunctional DNA-binding transcriptional regulator/antitoxin component of YhaV-PrlF toxin-antitoxin module